MCKWGWGRLRGPRCDGTDGISFRASYWTLPVWLGVCWGGCHVVPGEERRPLLNLAVLGA